MRCSNGFDTDRIHSPPVVSREITVMLVIVTATSLTPHTHRVCRHSTLSTEPTNCWLLLAINLKPLPASLYSTAFMEFTARYAICEIAFGSTNDFLRRNRGKPCRVYLCLRTPVSPFVDQTNLTSISALVLSPHETTHSSVVALAGIPYNGQSRLRPERVLSLAPKLRLHRWASCKVGLCRLSPFHQALPDYPYRTL